MASDRSRRDLVLLALASFLVQLPFLDRGISFWDEGSILAIADALRQGGRLYADHVTPVAPLTYELLAALLGWLGPGLWVGRALQALVLSGCVALAYAIVAPLAGRRPALLGAIAILGVKPLGFPLWTIVNYSQIAMLWCLLVLWCVVRFLAERRLAWLLGAGLGAGLTLVTKQNLGAMIGALAGTVLLVDWLREEVRRAPELVRRGAALAAGAALVVATTLSAYAAHGTLGALVERAVLGPLYLTAPYFVPLPGPELWALRPAELPQRIFAHFPSPVFDLLTDGRFDASNAPLVLALEHAVKAAYYAPVLLFALAALGLARTLRRLELRVAWSQRFALLLFAAASWASMLYRADWTHLMNVYPAVLVLAALLWPSGSGAPRAARVAAFTGAALWVAASVAMTAVVLGAYQTPLDTPRGRMRARPTEITEVKSVLAFLGARPPSETLLVLRSDPLYYFLAGLRVPIPFDLVVPGYLTAGDDVALAARLGEIDQILYDPAWIPTMPKPISEYLPRTSETLASGFRIDRILTPNAFVLKRSADSTRSDGEDVVDVWERFAGSLRGARGGEENPFDAARDRGFHDASWMMYRVVAATLSTRGEPACFEWSYRPAAGESVSVLPVMTPALWIWAKRKPGAIRVRYEIAARTPSGSRLVLYSERWPAAPPVAEIRAPLDTFAGQEVALEFCTELVEGPPFGIEVGWAEPRIVRRRDARSPVP